MVPPKRTPGYVLVVILIVVGLLVAVLVITLRPRPVLGPSVLLVRADGNATATPTDTSVPTDFGPHCSPLHWDPEIRALTVETAVDLTGVEGVLLQHHRPETGNLQSDGGDLTRAALSTSAGVWRVASPVDGSTLTIFARSGANVTANGREYTPGQSWTMRFEYDAATVNGTVHVVEVVTFQNEGVVPTHRVPSAACM